MAVLFYMQSRGISINDRTYILFVIILPLFIGLLVSFLISHSIKDDIEDIFSTIDEITSIKSISKIENSIIAGKYYNQELSDLHYGVGKLLSKIQEMTIDKNIFEFEISLLEKFIITSDLVLNWKNSVFYILREFNKAISLYNIFTVFVNESVLEINVFWNEPPSEEGKESFNELIKKSIIENDEKFKEYGQNLEQIVITHETSICYSDAADSGNNSVKIVDNSHNGFPHTYKIDDDAAVYPAGNGQGGISLQTKKIMLNAPEVNGIVGIGIQSGGQNAAKDLLINGILTSLINVIGSAKAIYKYTKDLEFYATRDGLTGLYNQRVFREFLSNAVHRAKRNNGIFAFVLIDLDNFKSVNDNYGHKIGDKILQGIAGILSQNKRGEDILARYGGDEFVMILQDASEEDAYRIMERTRQKIFSFGIIDPDSGENVQISASIGISVFPKSASNEDDLFILADNMMYKAKMSGKNSVHLFNEDDFALVLQEINEKKNIIINAIQNDLILPYFQPIKALNNSELESGILFCELLMRINIDGNIITAGEFIETAENMGVAYKLDLMLIEKAFRKISNENYKGLIFINISPKSAIISDYINSVKDCALKYGVNTQNIVLEITERDTVKNISLLEKFVSSLKFEGFRFAIDDFGSGYNSFLYVKYLPVDFIKIDGEFSRGLVKGGIMDRAVIMSLVTIARELKIKTIAEYIESAEIMEAVKELGVDFAQGFHVGRPSGDLPAY
jgi:diguanylate cyclase (GGDEF)-like protein